MNVQSARNFRLSRTGKWRKTQKNIYKSGRSTYSIKHLSVSTVGDTAFPFTAARLCNSLPPHVTAAPPSPSFALVLNHISCHFLIPLSDSSLICTITAQ